MKFALVGNPNSGKTTLFNALTGSTAHVGNWPGVTIDKKEGVYKKLIEPVNIVDLPGIYSMSPYTPEEIVSRDFVLKENPELIIDIVDSTNLERNLYLTTQLLELNIPVIIALNMSDVLKKNGDNIDIEKLEKSIGVPVVPISALKNSGVKELMERGYKVAKEGRKGFSAVEQGKLSDMLKKVVALYEKEKIAESLFHATKMIEKDEVEVKTYPNIAKKVDKLRDKDEDYECSVAEIRYDFIAKNYGSCLTKGKREEGLSHSDKIDKVLTHRIWGIPLFLLIMLGVFHCIFSEKFLLIGYILQGVLKEPMVDVESMTEGARVMCEIIGIHDNTIYSPGVILFNCMDQFTGLIGSSVNEAMSVNPAVAPWATSLVCDGLFGGVFAVLSFLPQILFLFFFIAILEDSGYMARVAFIMDRAFRKFGLSGRSFMPLLMCFGCAVPGIMATRTLENDGERKRTIMLTPFMSCGAKLPIWAAFAGVFALKYSQLNATGIVFSAYFLGIAVAVIGAILLKKVDKDKEVPPFIMELPAYHAPQAKNIAIRIWDKLKHYLVRAATLIAGSSLVLWFLQSFNFAWQLCDVNDSILADLGTFFRWIFIPLGFGMGPNGWRFIVAAVTGLIAKEMVIATMGTMSGVDDALDLGGEEISDTALGGLMLSIGGTLGGVNVAIPAMFSFIFFNLLSIPCMAAVAAARNELKLGVDEKQGKKRVWGAIGYWMGTAYLISLITFWFGTLCVYRWWAGLIVGLIAAAAFISLIVVKAVKISKNNKGGGNTPNKNDETKDKKIEGIV